jgi:hypothetical protein
MNLNISFQVLENIELNEKSFNGHLLQVLKFWRKREGDKAKSRCLDRDANVGGAARKALEDL